MSLLVATPDLLVSAATDLGSVGSALNEAHAAATVSTKALAAAGADEVSASVASVFAGHGRQFHALSARANAFHQEFVRALSSGAASYLAAEAADAAPLQAVATSALTAINAPTKALFGRPLIGNATNGTAASPSGGALSGTSGAAGAATPTNVTVPLHMHGNYPEINLSVNGGRSVPVLVDTGAAGLVIPLRYIGLQHLGLPTGIGVASYDAGLHDVYLKFDTTVNFGNGAVTAPTTVDAVIFKYPTSLAGLKILITGQSFAGASGDLGLGPSVAGNPAPGGPNNIVTTALPGQLNQGELIKRVPGLPGIRP